MNTTANIQKETKHKQLLTLVLPTKLTLANMPEKSIVPLNSCQISRKARTTTPGADLKHDTMTVE